MAECDVASVCVIGAGLSGLVALRHLTDPCYNGKFRVEAFEQTAEIGGTWVYTESTGNDRWGLPIHSSMYRDLRTNLPKEIMAIPGFDYNANLPSYISHEDVLNYLNDFTDHYKIRGLIKFNHLVEMVKPINSLNGVDTKWDVQVKNLQTNKIVNSKFDSVIVCNGHYKDPFIPSIPGLESFTGKWLHSHSFRVPEAYKGKTVLCVGAMSSGQDITRLIADQAIKVYLSVRAFKIPNLGKDNLQIIGEIDTIEEEKIKTKDGSCYSDIDVILFCTGYKYNFSFLHPTCRLLYENNRISPLYQRIVHAKFPTLHFIGLLEQINPTSLSDTQIKFSAFVLENLKKLPSSEEMYLEDEKFYSNEVQSKDSFLPGATNNKPLRMLFSQWDYYDTLAEIAGFEKIPLVIKNMFSDVLSKRLNNFVTYKSYNYKVLDSKTFEVSYLENNFSKL